MLHTLTQAIEERTSVSFIYNGVRRRVDIHILGLNKDGQIALRGYQDYTSDTKLKQGFKLFFLSDITGLIVLSGKQFMRRPEYRRHDSYFTFVLCSL